MIAGKPNLPEQFRLAGCALAGIAVVLPFHPFEVRPRLVDRLRMPGEADATKVPIPFLPQNFSSLLDQIVRAA
jgi:hypothetical protein